MKTARAGNDRYVWERPGSRFFWFSMAVPKEHQADAGRKVVQCSLGTTDRREASILAGKKRAELFARWRCCTVPALPASTAMPAEYELDEAAVVLGYELPMADADAGRRTLAGKGPNMYRAHVNYVRADLEDQVRATATGDDSLVRDLADEAMSALGVDLDRGSEGYRKLVDRLNASRLANLKAQHRRNTGDMEATGESAIIERVRQREQDYAKPGETIMKLSTPINPGMKTTDVIHCA